MQIQRRFRYVLSSKLAACLKLERHQVSRSDFPRRLPGDDAQNQHQPQQFDGEVDISIIRPIFGEEAKASTPTAPAFITYVTNGPPVPTPAPEQGTGGAAPPGTRPWSVGAALGGVPHAASVSTTAGGQGVSSALGSELPGTVEMLPSQGVRAGVSPPVIIVSSPGKIPAGSGLSLSRISLPNKLEFNIELWCVQTQPVVANHMQTLLTLGARRKNSLESGTL